MNFTSDPSLPIVENITLHVVWSLEQITIANGYYHDVTVDRVKQNGNSTPDGQLIVIPDHPTLNPSSGRPADQSGDNPNDVFIRWTQPYAIEAFVREPQKSSVPIDQRIQKIRCDVERALVIDGSRAKLAERTRIANPQLGIRNDPPLAEVRIEVDYHTLRSDPRKQTIA